MYIKYQITPKTIDDSGTENPLPDFVIASSFTNSSGSNQVVIPFADKYVTLNNSLDATKSFDFQSDKAVNLAFYDEAGTILLIELPNIYNQIIKSSGFKNILKVRNLSGETATILWRAYE